MKPLFFLTISGVFSINAQEGVPLPKQESTLSEAPITISKAEFNQVLEEYSNPSEKQTTLQKSKEEKEGLLEDQNDPVPSMQPHEYKIAMRSLNKALDELDTVKLRLKTIEEKAITFETGVLIFNK